MKVSIVATIDSKKYSLLPLSKVAKKNGYSVSYLRFMADTGQVIATKISGRWFVSENLSKHSELTPVPDAP